MEESRITSEQLKSKFIFFIFLVYRKVYKGGISYDIHRYNNMTTYKIKKSGKNYYIYKNGKYESETGMRSLAEKRIAYLKSKIKRKSKSNPFESMIRKELMF